jgi:hypothetical protein
LIPIRAGFLFLPRAGSPAATVASAVAATNFEDDRQFRWIEVKEKNNGNSE